MHRCCCLALVLLSVSTLPAEEDLVHRWQLTPDHIKEGKVQALAGSLNGDIVGHVSFTQDAPRVLLLEGNSRARHCIHLTDTIAKAGLPKKTLSVEAWVR